MATIGIIGFGSFGKFLAEKLSSYAKVLVYSRDNNSHSWASTIEEVAAADYVILAMPLNAYEAVLEQIKPLLRPESVLVDVCSVKEKPVRIIQQIMPEQPLVATHPMFGPESAGVQVAGHTLVMCPEVSDSTHYQVIKSFAEQLGLNVQEMTAGEHDKSIAVVQGLTFFVARTLENMGIHDEPLHTPSFARLLHLAELEQHHSQELFETIQLGNDYTAVVRDTFLAEAQKISAGLNSKKDS